MWLANSNGLALGCVEEITRGLLKIDRLRLKVIWQTDDFEVLSQWWHELVDGGGL